LLELTDFDKGFFIGLLVGEGHFGGDGRQPQITVKMHVDHGAVFSWLTSRFPGGRLYGPYHHADRHYYQWMLRGRYLKDVIVPFLDDYLLPTYSMRAYKRFLAMKERYKLG